MSPPLPTLLSCRHGWHKLGGAILPCVCWVTVAFAENGTPSIVPSTSPLSEAAPSALSEQSPRSTAARGYLGVTLTEICPEVRAHTTLKDGEGLMIGRVASDSPAAAFGLRHFDILTKFNDQWIISPAQFITLVENAGPGSEINLTVLRRGAMTQAKVTLAKPPLTLPAASLAPLPEEMLTSVIRLLRDNPVELETVHRLLHSARGGMAGVAPAPKQGSRVTLHNEDGEVEITTVDGRRQVRAWDQSGQLLFEGPCNSPEEHEAIPEALRPRVERLLEECRDPKERRSLPVIPIEGQPSLGRIHE